MNLYRLAFALLLAFIMSGQIVVTSTAFAGDPSTPSQPAVDTNTAKTTKRLDGTCERDCKELREYYDEKFVFTLEGKSYELLDQSLTVKQGKRVLQTFSLTKPGDPSTITGASYLLLNSTLLFHLLMDATVEAGWNKIVAYSLKEIKLLWQKDFASRDDFPFDVVANDGHVWVTTKSLGKMLLDSKTGEIISGPRPNDKSLPKKLKQPR